MISNSLIRDRNPVGELKTEDFDSAISSSHFDSADLASQIFMSLAPNMPKRICDFSWKLKINRSSRYLARLVLGTNETFVRKPASFAAQIRILSPRNQREYRSEAARLERRRGRLIGSALFLDQRLDRSRAARLRH